MVVNSLHRGTPSPTASIRLDSSQSQAAARDQSPTSSPTSSPTTPQDVPQRRQKRKRAARNTPSNKKSKPNVVSSEDPVSVCEQDSTKNGKRNSKIGLLCKKVISYSNFVRHWKSHDKKDNFQCDSCGRTFSRLEKQQSHLCRRFVTHSCQKRGPIGTFGPPEPISLF